MLLIMSTKEDDLIARDELLQQAIATLQLIIEQIQSGGELAPPGGLVSRYQPRGKQGFIGTTSYTLFNQFSLLLNQAS